MQGTLLEVNYSQHLKAHADLLAEFFTTLFSSDDKVLIVAGLDDAKYKELCEHFGDHPYEIAKRDTTYRDEKTGRVMPRRYLDPITRSLSSRETRKLADLHELNRHGYGIYFAINPMLGRRRCQRAVVMAKHILMESDESDIDAQMRFMDIFADSIISSVHSGGKSIHHLIRVFPHRWNPHRVRSHLAAMQLKKGQTRAQWQDYRDMARYWEVLAEMFNVKADTSSASDHSRVSRVPGFLHQKTGNASSIIRLNSFASWNPDILADWNNCPDYIPDYDEVDSYLTQKEASVLQHDRDRLTGDDGLFPELSPFGRDRTPWWEDAMGEPRACVTLKDLVEDMEEEKIATRDVVRSTTPNGSACHPQTSFLDSMEEFEHIRRKGLPGRHTRRIHHKILFDTARMYQWTEERMAEEWKRVIMANPTATVETPENAVEDMLAAWRASPDIGLYWPNLANLPEFDNNNTIILEDRLSRMGCDEPMKAGRIITKVIIPLIRELPRKCAKGSVGIYSGDLRNACRIEGHSRRYKETWGWMQIQNIVTCTNEDFCPGSRTRQYDINVPLVLWLAGYVTRQLDWRMAG